MLICKRISDWWWGIPTNPIDQNEFGQTVIWPVGQSVLSKIKCFVRPAFTSISKFLTFLIVTAFAGAVGWAVFVYLKALTGLG